MGPYILDFYCPEKKLAVEVDGGSHFTDDVMEYDRGRQTSIEQLGIHFLRFTNTDIKMNLYGVLIEIQKTIEE